jgi:DNA-binding NtrC family response regulator
MSKTLTGIIGSIILAGSLVGCASKEKKYEINQETYDRIVNWTVKENIDDLSRYVEIMKLLNENKIEEAKKLIIDYSNKERKELDRSLEILEYAEEVSPDLAQKLKNFIDDYSKQAEKTMKAD